MKKWDFLVFVLIATFILMPLVGGVLHNLEYVKGPALSGNTGNDQQEQIQGWLTLVTAILTVGVLVFQAVIFTRQADTMHRQTVLIESQTAILTGVNRAFVSVKEFKCEWLYHPNNLKRIISWRFTPIFENSGNSTARHFVCFANYEPHTPKLIDNFDYPDLGEERLLRPTLIRAHGTIDGPSLEIAVPVLMAAKAGFCEIYIWGWGEYSDSLDIKTFKRIEFCNRLVVSGDPKIGDCRFAWYFHTEHNGEDEDCMRTVGERANLRQPVLFDLTVPIERFAEFGITPDDLSSVSHHDTRPV